MAKSISTGRALKLGLFWIAAMFAAASIASAQSTELRRIGVLTPGGDFGGVIEGLREGLAQLGYGEGKQVQLMIQDTKMEAVDPVKSALQLVEAKPDLIVTVATSHAAAAKKAVGNIPVVFTVLTDPVQGGFVASFASSKNNFTGVSNSVAPLSGKRLELLKEIVPSIRRALAVVAVKETIAQKSFQFLSESADKFGVQLVRREVSTKEDLEKVLLGTPKGAVDAIVHVPAILLRNNISLIVDKANKDKLPFGVHTEELVKRGALMSYGEDNRLIGLQAAKIVVKVLKGVPPAEIPVETPERPVLVVNRSAAKTIGLKIPAKFLERADRIL